MTGAIQMFGPEMTGVRRKPTLPSKTIERGSLPCFKTLLEGLVITPMATFENRKGFGGPIGLLRRTLVRMGTLHL
ncbi:hypothetical protein JTE90_014722 [Oedothorax gibbosus]|uniref:Uncharacterized protein n=1 Tax=Oedothorax gibbosus TaxID=931172 RepID=A0AAV6UTS3_9ARAC|nr:hypothetical protein JTE90_014722 [Oedothorax gibbosus]